MLTATGDHKPRLRRGNFFSKDDSCIVLRPDKSVQPYRDNSDKVKGKRIRVHWEEKVIPEAGEKMKTVTKVEARKS